MLSTSSLEVERIATIGFFDGVHKGHRYLFEQLREQASSRGLAPLIITFDTHPRAALQSDYVPQLLTTPAERRALLEPYGEVLILPFEQVQPLTAAQFMEQLHTQYGVSVLLMGYDHRFGSDRLQHPQDYRRIGASCGIEVLTIGEFVDGEWHVSSTEIRAALETGNIAVANDLLGRPYSLSGTVIHGNGIGRTLGFPTANLQPDDPQKIIPKKGVYEVKVCGERLKANGERVELTGICNIGMNPTIGNSKLSIEVYIPSYDGDLYESSLTLEFVRHIREERCFKNTDELREQIKADVDSIRRPV